MEPNSELLTDDIETTDVFDKVKGLLDSNNNDYKYMEVKL
jgi:hypothetical protein